MAVKILIDSASDISQVEAQEMGIEMIPLVINFGNEEYFDGVDLLPSDFYKKLKTDANHPKTSQISPFRFEERFHDLTKNGDDLVVICLSSKLSGTYEGAKNVAEDKFSGKVYVVDSLSATVGERLLCQYALQLVKDGATAAEVAKKLTEAKDKLKVMGVLDTLEYLKKGGRISSTVAFVGGALKIKPVVSVIDGEVKLVAKAMGERRGISALCEYAKNCGKIDFNMPYCILWSGEDDYQVNKYQKQCNDIFDDGIKPVPKHVVGSTIGTHVGPNAVGIAFFVE